MSKDLNLKGITDKLSLVLKKAKQYLPLIFIVGFLVMYGLLVFNINSLNGAEPSDDAVTEKLNTVQRPKVDQDTISKLQQLRDNSSEVQTLFQGARDNPFQE